MENSTEILKKIDRIEGILDYKLHESNIPFWVLFRWDMYLLLEGRKKADVICCSKELMKPKKSGLLKRMRKDIKQNLRYFFLNIVNKKMLKNKKILFFKTNKGYVVDGVYHENVYDTFIKAEPAQSVVLKSYSFVSKLKKKTFDYDISYNEGLCSPRNLKRIQTIEDVDEEDKERLKEFLSVIENEGTLDEKLVFYMKNNIVGIYKRILLNYIMVNNILKYMKRLRLVVLSEACYSYNSEVCLFFQKKGIPVLEIQHGTIYEHPCYNYAGDLQSEIIKLYQPTYFGLWSEYWKKKITLTPKLILLGNDEIVRGLEIIEKKADGKNILFCTSVDKEKSKDWIDQFLKMSRDDLSLVVRLHPQHTFARELEEIYKEEKNIFFDRSSNIYMAFRNKIAILAEHSTVIYEAQACGIRAFNMWNDYSNPYEQEGILVRSMKEMIEIIDCTANEELKADKYKKKYFGNNARANFVAFIDSLN